MKPFKGEILNWTTRQVDPIHEHEYKEKTLGFYVTGTFKDHPQFHGRYGHTSMIVKVGKRGMVETLNSRYRLVGPRAPLHHGLIGHILDQRSRMDVV